MSSSPSSVLITGGADGLGKCLALAAAASGASVTVADVDEAKARALAGSNERISFVALDLARLSDDWVHNLPGSPVFDTVICNAGISASGPYPGISWQHDLRVIEINALGHMHLVKQLLQQHRLTPGGRLAFIASASVFVPVPVAVGYAASKAMLDGFAFALQSWLLPMKISVTRVYPGAMKTAHQRFYRAVKPGMGIDAQKVADRVWRAVCRRRKTCHPDAMSRTFRLLSTLLPWMMPWLAWRVTTKYGDWLYPQNPDIDWSEVVRQNESGEPGNNPIEPSPSA